jgi:hypothetical protein
LNTKKLKVIAMILLTSTLLILAASAVSIPNVKAATTTTLVVYTTLGGASTGAVKANGTPMVMGSSGNALTTGASYTFTATAASGYQFIGWAYADATGPSGTTSASYTKVISAPCSLEAIFIPTTNTTATTSGSGAATLSLFATAGGTTSPLGTPFTGSAISATIGTAKTITQTPGTGYTFLCWVVQCSSNNYYTSSTLSYTPTSSGAAIEALWIPTSSGIVLPSTSPTPTPTKVDEVGPAMAAIVAIALVATAFGTYAITKKRQK